MRSQRLLERIKEERLTLTASGVAFWIFLSVFPAGLATVNVLGLIDTQEHVAAAVATLAALFPGNFGRLVAEQLATVATPTPGTWWIDCVLVLLSLWTISTAYDLTFEAVRRSCGAPARARGRNRLVALVAALATIPLIAAIAYVAYAIDVAIVQGIVEVCALFAAVAVVYRIGSRGRLSWRATLPGAALAAFAFAATFAALRLYLSIAPNMVAIYGATSGVVGAMLVVWTAAFSVVTGALVNVLLQERSAGVPVVLPGVEADDRPPLGLESR